jgi:RNA-binding protein 26
VTTVDPYDPLRPNNNAPAALPVIPRAPLPVVTPRLEIHKGPNHTDKSNTTLVVDGIPAGEQSKGVFSNVDKFNEPTIREWFGQFGPLNEVIVDQSWGKAILVYADYESAAKAWNDPRPVFSNRFVKIWWKKSEPAEPVDKLSSGIVDQVELEVAREAARKAQKEHEEKQRRKLELEKQKEELEQKRLELVEKQRVERERLMEKIKHAEEKAKEKARGVVNSATLTAAAQKSESATPAAESPSPEKSTNGEVPQESENVEENSRKAQLQKMLSDLQLQVLSSGEEVNGRRKH